MYVTHESPRRSSSAASCMATKRDEQGHKVSARPGLCGTCIPVFAAYTNDSKRDSWFHDTGPTTVRKSEISFDTAFLSRWRNLF